MNTMPTVFYERLVSPSLEQRMFQGKALIVYGPRQSGKTTVLRHLLSHPEWNGRAITLNGDDPDTVHLLADATAARIQPLLGNKDIVFLDEAQRIENIGLVLKRLVDGLPQIQVLVSGSSSLDLVDKTSEPLTGRKFEWTLLPFSFEELALARSPLEETRELERRLVFGCYPEIVLHPGDETDRLRTLAGSYLYRDVLALAGIRRPEILTRLLRAIALQIGGEVVWSEVAQTIGTDDKTVVRYIDLLERSFVLFTMPSYARNLRNELRKSRKVYFFDTGVRNAILGDFRPISAREDAGALWENYLMAERFKWRLAHAPDTRAFFWRTTQQKEIDLVEESAEGLRAFEFKWNSRRAPSAPSAFRTAYPDAVFSGVTPGNYHEFLLSNH